MALLITLKDVLKEMEQKEIQDLTGLLAGIRHFIKTIETGEVKFSIPELIYLIDNMIGSCERLKNKLLDIRWAITNQRQEIYRENENE